MAKSVRLNIISNYLGSGWAAVAGFIFVPLYIHFLGVEAYGLIGLFATLQVWIGLLDFGLAGTLSRELARHGGGEGTPEYARDILRSTEVVYFFAVTVVIVAFVFGAPWIASSWLKASSLSVEEIVRPLQLCGFVIGVRWLGSLYRGSLAGLQEQVWANFSLAIFATLRGLGAVAVLAWVSPTIEAFFVFQAIVVTVETATLAMLTYLSMPRARRGRFSLVALRGVWRFAGGNLLLGILAVLVTQIDRLMSSGMLTLEAFGYYALAGTVSGALLILASPIGVATGPRLAQLAVQGDTPEIRAAYHRYAQLLTLAVIPAALVVAFFADHLLALWTRDGAVVANAAPILTLLSIAAAANGLMHVPNLLRIAFARFGLLVSMDVVAAVLLVLLLLVTVPRFGAAGAAASALAVNVLYAVMAVPLLHRSLLRGEASRWFLEDVLPATTAVAVVLEVLRLVVPYASVGSPLTSLTVLPIAALVALTVAAAASPLGRRLIRAGAKRTLRAAKPR